MLSDAQIDFYRANGYLAPVDVLGADEVGRLRAELEAVERTEGGPLQGAFRHKSHLLFPWLSELIRHPRLLDAIEDVLGPDILCWNTNLFTKEARDPGYVSWHQDATYWGLSAPLSVTAWVALSASTPESGCVRVLPASHLQAQLPHQERPDAANLLSRGQEVAVEVDEADAVDLVLRRGQCSLHHLMTVHGSRPNHSADRRIGIAIRYIAASVRQLGGKDYATLVRGHDRERHFEAEPVPRRSLDEAALAAHGMVMARHTELLMGGTGDLR
jgi:ectoine hydroxylase-related dioxygenase (phytanoyl-CoA dioxygenase family)